MDSKFQQDAAFLGMTANAVKLGTILTFGMFWVRTSGCHTIYRGQDGNMNYNDVQAVMELADSQIAISNQDLPVNTNWRYIRRQVSYCGLESADSPVCDVKIDSSGDVRLAAPNPPLSLTATPQAGGKIKLQWRYSTYNQAVAPTGFRVYIDSGSGFDFETPTATVSAPSVLSRIAGYDFSWTSDALSHGTTYRFCVQSYKTASGETQNTNYVAAVADSVGPNAITDLRSRWEVI